MRPALQARRPCTQPEGGTSAAIGKVTWQSRRSAITHSTQTTSNVCHTAKDSCWVLSSHSLMSRATCSCATFTASGSSCAANVVRVAASAYGAARFRPRCTHAHPGYPWHTDTPVPGATGHTGRRTHLVPRVQLRPFEHLRHLTHPVPRQLRRERPHRGAALPRCRLRQGHTRAVQAVTRQVGTTPRPPRINNHVCGKAPVPRSGGTPGTPRRRSPPPRPGPVWFRASTRSPPFPKQG